VEALLPTADSRNEVNLAGLIKGLAQILRAQGSVNRDGQTRPQPLAIAQAGLDTRVYGLEILDHLANGRTRHGNSVLAAG
jgi:hypothetical protein